LNKPVTVVANKQVEAYRGLFEHFGSKFTRSDQTWLDHMRQEAIHRFAEIGFPTTRDEAWKYTNLSGLAALNFEPAGPASADSMDLARWPLGEVGGCRLAFLNGRFWPELYQMATVSRGVRVERLETALTDAQLENRFGRLTSYRHHPFIALNTALFEEGAYIEIPLGAVVKEPIFLVYVSIPSEKPSMTHPRNLIVAGPDSQATIVECHLGVGEGVYFTNAVTEIIAGENSAVEYVKIQQEGPGAYHIASVASRQERSSTLATFSIALGAGLAREDLTVVLDGEGADVVLNGLAVETGKQHVDNYTTLDHAKPHASSRELYKGVLDGHSSGVFHGRIIVRPDAQKTDAKQSNKNLLLSEDAVINTKPQLEIYADDVKCTHGATVGQVDAEAVFYLRSRGIGLDQARSMLTLAFANEILDRIKEKTLSERLRSAVAGRLNGIRRRG
jgi:Fe-S cluster assembly protein SufD